MATLQQINLALNMVTLILQGESRVDRVTNPYTLIPITLDYDDDNEQSYDFDEFCGTPWRIARTIVGFIALFIFCLIIFCLMIPIIIEYDNDSPNSHIFPPFFFLQSLNVATFNISQGELSATWNVDLTISNGVNSTLINFLNFKAFMVYKEDKVIALSAPIQSEDLLNTHGIFVMDKNENKTLHLTFNTTGWERDQPIVDDDVIQEIDEEMKLGAMSFGLKVEVEAEIEINKMNVPVTMQPYCSNLEVDLSPLEQGEVATLDDVGVDRECLYNVDQWNINDVGN